MPDTRRNTILVPWDFTGGSEIALAHAYQLAQAVGDNIMLIHFVQKPRKWFGGSKRREEYEKKVIELRASLEQTAIKSQEGYASQRLDKLNAQSDEAGARRETHEVNFISLVLGYERSLEKALRHLYLTIDINLVVAHPDFQLGNGDKLNMVNVLRKVKSGKADTLPFIIVTRPPTHKYYSDLVVPMDYDNSYKEVLRWVAFLSKYYHCNVNLIKPPLRDLRKKKGLQSNLYFTKKILDMHNVIYGIKTASKREGFRSEIFAFAKSIDADLVVIMTDKLQQYFNNYQIDSSIPCLFINPLSKKYQSFY